MPDLWKRALQVSHGHSASELGPHVERAQPQPRIYVDANMPAGLVSFMRQSLHWDVLFVIEHDDLRRARDGEHYRLARQLRRTLITLDRDYLDDRKFPPDESGGVIVLMAPEERGYLNLLKRLDQRSVSRRPNDSNDPNDFPWKATSFTCMSTGTACLDRSRRARSACRDDRPQRRRRRVAGPDSGVAVRSSSTATG